MKALSFNRLVFIVFLILFRFSLDISYVFVISKVFAYDGFIFGFSVQQYAFSWIVYTLSFLFVRDRLYKVSDYFFSTALLSVLAPLTSLFGLDATRPLVPVLVVFFSIYFIYLFTRVKFISFDDLPVVRSGRAIGIGISVFFVGFLVVWYFVSGAALNLDFSKVYEYRAENAELSGGGILAYTNNWTYQIFNVFLMALALFYRRYAWFFVLLAIQVYFFAASTHKTVLFLPVLLVGVWYYFRKHSSLAIMPFAFTLIISLTLFSYFFLEDLWMSSLFSRRVFFVPANLTFVYFDFFENNPNVYWSNSVLSYFVAYPYNLSLTHVVGGYMGRDGMGANNGFVASGYAHAGFFGVFVYVVLIGVLLRIINDLTYNRMPLWLAVSLCVVPMRALLISSDLFTVMLTHGFIAAILLTYLVRVRSV
ncbi:hypothetical protein EF096_17815 [Pseudomonas neustonica]|uniref:Oligosaccharide repeat unit polymerase n=1 Tax=Pseudomonas neustonica TaxID=2487346 RepID=A0ABX9XDY4_9PSED|nr:MULTISPECIES: hypothetical protein [Pseudomonas]ROZ80435.1 hypothetical protein EF099_17810 [Pseudomonas sp. SSM44]ROZ81207.1 hypothetical protein EF096_17815 [Pseudomonas neustonica]